MTNAFGPTERFAEWLPGELVYSATKAGYDKKIGRAHLPIDDRLSIYGHLGDEWHNYQLASKQGAHYMPFHGKSGQLQLAKFAAGLYDKVALGEWMQSGTDATIDNFVIAARATAAKVVAELPTGLGTGSSELLKTPFEETAFAPGIAALMESITKAAELDGQDRTAEIEKFTGIARALGDRAFEAYRYYAFAHLQADQYALPASELSDTQL